MMQRSACGRCSMSSYGPGASALPSVIHHAVPLLGRNGVNANRREARRCLRLLRRRRHAAVRGLGDDRGAVGAVDGDRARAAIDPERVVATDVTGAEVLPLRVFEADRGCPVVRRSGAIRVALFVGLGQERQLFLFDRPRLLFGQEQVVAEPRRPRQRRQGGDIVERPRDRACRPRCVECRRPVRPPPAPEPERQRRA